MKKIFKTIIISIFLITLTACSDEKTYKEKGLEIIMDKGFYYKTHSQADIYFVKGDITFTALRDKYDSLEKLDLNSDSNVTDYMQTLFANLGDEYIINDYEGLKYFIYSANDDNVTYNYLVTIHKGSDSFWVCSFSSSKDTFTYYQENFLKWSKTIKVK